MLPVETRPRISQPAELDLLSTPGMTVLGRVNENVSQLNGLERGSPFPRFVESVALALGDYCMPLDIHGAQVVETGSGAKRLIGGTPLGWETPRKIWQEIVGLEPRLKLNQSATRISTGGSNDVDLRFQLKPGADFFSLKEMLVAQAVLNGLDAVEIKTFEHGTSRQIVACVNNALTLSLGEVPHDATGNNTAIELDNCRQSWIMPTSEAFCVVYIKDGLAYFDEFAYATLFGEVAVFNSFWLADLPLAAISAQRAMLTNFWWPPRLPKVHGGVYFWPILEERGFWKRTINKTLDNRQHILESRQAEIVANSLLLLTQGMRNLRLMQSFHLLDYTGIQRLIEERGLPDINEADYEAKFKAGELQAAESLPVKLSKHLGMTLEQFIGSLEITV